MFARISPAHFDSKTRSTHRVNAAVHRTRRCQQKLVCETIGAFLKATRNGTARRRENAWDKEYTPMKFIRLLFKNLFRNKLRTSVTMGSIAVSLFLVATLITVLVQLQNPPETPDSALRLISRHRVSIFNSIPSAYRQKIEQLDGVEAVSGSMWFGGVYKDPKNFFAQFSVDVDSFFDVYPDIIVSEDEKQAFIEDRTGCIAGRMLADTYGWKIGEKIHLKGALFQFDPELTLRAIYEGGPDDGGNTLYFHWEYFNEGMNDAGFTGTYAIRASSSETVASLAEEVDELFRNSPVSTKTESEKSFILGFVSLLGNVQFLITSICMVVIFTIVLVAANTMAMAIRERGREIAIFKALGFRRKQILSLLLFESIFLSLIGALLGAFGAQIIFYALDQFVNLSAVSGGFIPRLNVSAATVGLCAAIGGAVGILAAGVPSWRAASQPVVLAMRRIV